MNVLENIPENQKKNSSITVLPFYIDYYMDTKKNSFYKNYSEEYIKNNKHIYEAAIDYEKKRYEVYINKIVSKFNQNKSMIKINIYPGGLNDELLGYSIQNFCYVLSIKGYVYKEYIYKEHVCGLTTAHITKNYKIISVY